MMKPYTVKVPAQLAGVNSARAQAFLRDFFIHPLALPADPGAGEHALRLTLNEKLVSKLAEGFEEKPAVALRRLLSAHIRELPATSSAASESCAIVPVRRRKKATARAHGVSEEARAEAARLREAMGRSMGLTPEARAQIERRIAELEGRAVETDPPRVRAVPRSWLSVLRDDSILRIGLLVLAALVVLGLSFGGGPRVSAGETRLGPKPRYPEWKPE